MCLTAVYLDSSCARTLKPIIKIGYNSVVFEKLRTEESYDFNTFVIDFQKDTSDCITPVYACFSFSKSKNIAVF